MLQLFYVYASGHVAFVSYSHITCNTNVFYEESVYCQKNITFRAFELEFSLDT